jgi:hypothetical protein
MTPVRSLLRWAAYALAAPMLGAGPVAGRLRMPRRLLGAGIGLRRNALPLRVLGHSMLSGAVGVVTYFLVFLAIVAAVRGIAYPLIAADNLENSWGGPTLAGAWAVHALLGLALLPVWLLVLAGMGALQMRLTRQLLGRGGSWWSIPLALVLGAGGVLLCIAWWHQA